MYALKRLWKCFLFAATLIRAAVRVSFSWPAVSCWVPSASFPQSSFISPSSSLISACDAVWSHMERNAVTNVQSGAAIMWASLRHKDLFVYKWRAGLESGPSFLSNSLLSQRHKLKVHWSVSEGKCKQRQGVSPLVGFHVGLTSTRPCHALCPRHLFQVLLWL